MSFVDCPGHDILMATMLNGAAVRSAHWTSTEEITRGRRPRSFRKFRCTCRTATWIWKSADNLSAYPWNVSPSQVMDAALLLIAMDGRGPGLKIGHAAAPRSTHIHAGRPGQRVMADTGIIAAAEATAQRQEQAGIILAQGIVGMAQRG